MSLYRKYRPQTFEDVVGQEHVARTLRNALSAQPPRVAHAYLFTGPRGIGKTTNARLLAKCLNCEQGPTPTPCNECDFCTRVALNQPVMDLTEIDAASNTGVDNIREAILDNVGSMPAQGRYKVYVIDECFRAEEPVTLADGSQMPIGKIVENELPVEVLCYNEKTQTLEAKPVVRWMKKVPHVPAVRVTFDNNRSIVCTLNHKFYTPDGLKHAGELEDGQFVYANYERVTQHQMDVVAGTALGDGHLSLTPSRMRARLRLTHGVAQKPYLDYKCQLLGDLVAATPRFQEPGESFSKTGTFAVSTLSRPQFALLHEQLYEGRRKRVSRAYLDQLTTLGLALWYLDDGSLVTATNRYRRRDGSETSYPATRSVFATYGFSPEEAHLIQSWLQERWGIENNVCVTAKGPVIWLSLPGTRRLHELIAPHVPPSMNYKLLPPYREQFHMARDENLWSGLAVSRVKSVEPAPAPPFVYNIEVASNHNYFVRDILVANCHMLSASSFNALLKTLEEPPAHAIFILATTDSHKVPATITSRCQRFDFRRVTPPDIAKRLQYVADCENMKLHPDAAKLIARHADGALRDALTLLEQVSAFSGDEIGASDVRLVLGGVPQELIDGMFDCVGASDAHGALELVEGAVDEGASFGQLARDLTSYARDLLLQTVGFPIPADLSNAERAARERHANELGRGKLEGFLTLLRESEKEMRSSTDHRLLLELCLVRACEGHYSVASTQVAPVQTPAAPRPNWREKLGVAPAPIAPPVPVVEAPERVREPEPIFVQPVELAAPPQPIAPQVKEDVPVESDAEVAEVASVQPVEAQEPSEVETMAPEAVDFVPEVVEAVPAKEPKKKGRRISTFEDLEELWPAVLQRVRKKISIPAASYLVDAQPVELSPDTIVLRFSKEFHFAKATDALGRMPFEEVINTTLDKPRHLKFVLATPEKKVEVVAQAEADDDDDEFGETRDLVSYAQSVFGADIVGRSG